MGPHYLATIQQNPHPKTLLFTEHDVTKSGDKGITQWANVGRLSGRRPSALDPVLELVNETARTNAEGNYQIQLTTQNINISTPASGFIYNRINNVAKTSLNNANFTASTAMEVTGETTISAIIP